MLRIVPINKRRERPNTCEIGSVTLETALVMPIFLLLVIFLIFMVRTAVISMALHGALSQTVRQAASAWYPIALATDQARGSEINRKIEQWNGKWFNAADTIGKYGTWFPSPMSEWAGQASNMTFSLEQHAARLAFGQLVEQFLDERVLDKSRLTMTSVGLPDVDDRAKAYLTVEAEYALPMRVPFLGRRLVLKESARERVWIGGSPSASRQMKEEGEKQFLVSFVSLEPNPVKPGRKATLVIRTEPGTTVDLSILYKSGLSQAKHLGSAVADESGLISWTWHVSGRTTPGYWNWKVSNGEGGTWEQSFEVVGKNGTATEVGEP
ncbi:TadE family protein [Cohnella terricola]|nr:TadE family protein [Cohnella terricola]